MVPAIRPEFSWSEIACSRGAHSSQASNAICSVREESGAKAQAFRSRDTTSSRPSRDPSRSVASFTGYLNEDYSSTPVTFDLRTGGLLKLDDLFSDVEASETLDGSAPLRTRDLSDWKPWMNAKRVHTECV